MSPDVVPLQETLAAFGVAAPRPLGGRVRKHWRVASGDRDLALSCSGESEASLRCEIEALKRVAAIGWPVPTVLEGPASLEGHWWTLAPFLPGEPLTGDDEPTQRGRLLAGFHASLDGLTFVQGRPGFRRAELVLTDPKVEFALAAAEDRFPREVAIVCWHFDKARERLNGIDLAARKGHCIHGDFTA